jgi:hypothetical protein
VAYSVTVTGLEKSTDVSHDLTDIVVSKLSIQRTDGWRISMRQPLRPYQLSLVCYSLASAKFSSLGAGIFNAIDKISRKNIQR